VVTAACLLLGHAPARADTIPEIVAKAKPAVDAKIYFDRGMDSLSLLHYDKAISDYSEAIRLDPDYANAYCGRGIAYLQTGNRAEVNADFATAERLKGGQ
jgi:Flp pilus assembly protein TadD